MRYVGDEVAPHGIGALGFGDVLRQHQLHAVAVGPHQYRQRGAATRPGKHHRIVPVPVLQVGHERRGAHEVGDALETVAFGVDAEVVGRLRVAPGDLLIGIEHRHAVGRGLDGRQELRQALLLLRCRALAHAQRTLDTVAQFTPQAGTVRCRDVVAAAQPGHQAAPAPGIGQRDADDTERGASEGPQHRPMPRTAEHPTHRCTAGQCRQGRGQPGQHQVHAVSGLDWVRR
jgi:hypothetical protein